MRDRLSCLSARTVRKVIASRSIWSHKLSHENQKGPGIAGALWECRIFGNRLDSTYVLGLQTLGTLLHLELHLRTFVQGAIAVGLYRRKMNEHIVTAGTLDKSVALCGIEPFHYAFFFHYLFS